MQIWAKVVPTTRPCSRLLTGPILPAAGTLAMNTAFAGLACWRLNMACRWRPPSYPDRAGFGRQKPEGSTAQLLGELKRQMDFFDNIATKLGCCPAHFKPHGQLYNDAAFQAAEAELLINLAHAFPHLKLLALANSPLVAWARSAGIEVIEEAFPDRAYLSTGALAPRSQPGAVLHDPVQVKLQAELIVRGGPLQCLDGSSRVVTAQTLCVHGDNAQALDNAKAVRAALTEHDQDTFSGAS